MTSRVVYSRRVTARETFRNIALWAGIAVVMVFGYVFYHQIEDAAVDAQAALVPGYPAKVSANEIVLGENQDSLSKDWKAANKAMYLPQLAGRTHPDSLGQKLIGLSRSGDYNLAPTLSPDGKLFAFFSSKKKR